jgi:hypothetical protein
MVAETPPRYGGFIYEHRWVRRTGSKCAVRRTGGEIAVGWIVIISFF